MSRGRVMGLNKVLFNLNKEIKGIQGRSKAGLKAAALKVKADSVRFTPIKSGNLRGSAYVDSGESTLTGPWAEIGYTAFYAPFVHEINKNYLRGGWKFLERALIKNRRVILNTIREFARLRR